jgi:hypothetical protein
VDRQLHTIGEAFALEKPLFRPLPAYPYRCCVSVPVSLNPYSQVRYETNSYSVPADQAKKKLVVRAYPFKLEILDGEAILAVHPRSYEREVDILDPLHYLPLLQRRPGAFEYAKPVREWRKHWPENYELLLQKLRTAWPQDGRAVREFVTILSLHRKYPAHLVETAIAQALSYGCPHLDGVKLCLHQLLEPDRPPASLDMTKYGELKEVARQPVDILMYEQLLLGLDPAEKTPPPTLQKLLLNEGEANGKPFTNGKLPQSPAPAGLVSAVSTAGPGCRPAQSLL